MLRIAVEAANDVIAWIGGVVAAAWITRDISVSNMTLFLALRAAGGIYVLALASGLLAGLYRSRKQRCSLNELVAVSMAAFYNIRLARRAFYLPGARPAGAAGDGGIGRAGEALVLDMESKSGLPTRRLAAEVPRHVDIVYTGLRPGEKLTEDLVGADEQDVRPYYPLIRHVPMSPLHPEEVIGPDAADALTGLRAALADSACLAR